MSKSPALHFYTRAVATVGLFVLAESVWALTSTAHPFEWLLFVGLAVLSGSFSMKIASVNASVTVSDTFFITTALLFGPAPATLAVALDTAIVSARRRHGLERTAFNTATTTIGMWAGTHVFFLISGVPPLMQVQGPVEPLIVALTGPLLALSGVYFVLNSGLIAVAIGLDARKSPFQIWRQHFMWLAVNCFAAASVAFILVMLMLIYHVSLSAVIVVLPLLVVLHLTLRSSFGRLEDARTHLAHLDRLYLSTVETLAMAIDAKDDVTHSHVRRVQAYAVGLARHLGVDDDLTIKAIEAAALLHDTGKLAVPEHILNKPGKLTPSEFDQMKRHVDIGADILSLVDFPYPVVPIVRCHHENWDGTGYPRGVRGGDIPIGARVLSVVDCFDALTSDRPYRSALSSEEAFEILRARSGTMYEPRVVETFIRVHSELKIGIVETPAQREVMRQITGGATSQKVQAPVPLPTQVAASGDVLAFASLARLVSGDTSVADVLALSSSLMTVIAPEATIAWYLYDETTHRLEVSEATGPAAHEIRGTSIKLGEGLSGWVAAHRQVIVNSEASLDLGPRAMQIAPALHCALGVPLATGDSLVGTVTMYSSRRAAFSEDHSRLVQIIAPHVAQAIRTAQRARITAGLPTGPARAADLKLVASR